MLSASGTFLLYPLFSHHSLTAVGHPVHGESGINQSPFDTMLLHDGSIRTLDLDMREERREAHILRR